MSFKNSAEICYVENTPPHTERQPEDYRKTTGRFAFGPHIVRIRFRKTFFSRQDERKTSPNTLKIGTSKLQQFK